jgi:hypothetical protein
MIEFGRVPDVRQLPIGWKIITSWKGKPEPPLSECMRAFLELYAQSTTNEEMPSCASIGIVTLKKRTVPNKQILSCGTAGTIAE